MTYRDPIAEAMRQRDADHFERNGATIAARVVYGEPTRVTAPEAWVTYPGTGWRVFEGSEADARAFMARFDRPTELHLRKDRP